MSLSDPLEDVPTLGAAAARLRPGASLGPEDRFLLEERVGHGGMGVVWRAMDREFEEEVALKFLPEVLGADELAQVDIQQEAKVLRRLAHPGIVRLHDLHRDGDLLFLAMELLEGQDLRRLLARRRREGGSLAASEALWVLEQVAPALDYAHGEGVWHRDLKPGNLLLTGKPGTPLGSAGERVKVADFGIAFVASSSYTQLTGRSHASGTLPYMAPEVLLGAPPSPRSDVYGLGATLFELVRGVPPFWQGDIGRQITDVPAPPLRSGRDSLDAAAAAALAKEPAERPASAGALLALAEGKELANVAPRVPRVAVPPPSRVAVPGTCPSCGAANPGDARFCRSCGAGLRMACPHCGSAELAGVPFCGRCGAALQAPEGGKAPEGWEVVEAEPAYQGWAHKVRDPRTGIVFLLVEPGTFRMGSPDGEAGCDDDEGPVHEVQITRPFYLGETQVTQAQWQLVMGGNPSHEEGDDLPVETVSWDEAMEFCRKAGYRLPTEAEWEYACRAGSTTRFSFGDDEHRLGEYAWYEDNSSLRTHPVGQKKPNVWGFHDMHGNVWEWCADWYEPGYYAQSPGRDPQGPSPGNWCVQRGGSWDDNPWYCRSAGRGSDDPTARPDFSGFRVARTP